MKTLKILSIAIFVIILCILLFYFLYFLRKPKRNIPNDQNLFISPVNWKIISIIHSQDESVEISKNNKKVLDSRTKDLWWNVTAISVMMTPLNVHYQKAPLDSKLIAQKYTPWKFSNAMFKSQNLNATFQNEHNEMLFETPDNIKFKIIQIAWTLARRIVPYAKINQEFKQWEIIWLIKFGSQVTIILDDQVNITAKIGQILIDWETIIATKK
jgi:phosphatidylserine decarboxylase